VKLTIGPDKIVYYTPRHVLPSVWGKDGLEKWFQLLDVDRETGHSLVHYLHNGAYETLEVTADTPLSATCAEFTRALFVYVMTTRYSGLKDLQRLAIKEMEDLGQRLDICDFLRAIKSHFKELQSSSWVHDYVSEKVKTAFAENPTLFKSKDFVKSMDNAYEGFLMRCVIDSYDKRIVNMTETERLLSDKLDEHMRGFRNNSTEDTLPEGKTEGLEEFVPPDVDDRNHPVRVSLRRMSLDQETTDCRSGSQTGTGFLQMQRLDLRRPLSEQRNYLHAHLSECHCPGGYPQPSWDLVKSIAIR
jgi:hypothetical protein